MRHGIFALATFLLWAVTAADAQARRHGRNTARGTIAVKATVQGAEVLIDNRRVGKTPLKPVRVAVGEHTVTVKKLGFLEFTEKVRVSPRRVARVLADLLPFAGVVKVTANVSGAEVSVDGKSLGKVPIEREVSIGEHVLVVRAGGHEPYRREFQADPGRSIRIRAELVATSGADTLALVPLGDRKSRNDEGSGGGSGGDDDLELTPLAALTPGAGGNEEDAADPSSGDDDSLALAPLTPLTPLSKSGGRGGPEQIAAVDPNALPPEGGGPTALRAAGRGPWYSSWWALSGAAAVVVGTAVTSALLLTGEQEEQTGTPIDLRQEAGGSWTTVR